MIRQFKAFVPNKRARFASGRTWYPPQESASEKKRHVPVLVRETIDMVLPPAANVIRSEEKKFIVDGTLGAGGHSSLLLRTGRLGRLIGIDRDPFALAIASETLDALDPNDVVAKSYFRDNFRHMKSFLPYDSLCGTVDGVLFDFGVSSMQLDDKRRGFSFSKSSKEFALDMRMGPRSAHDRAAKYESAQDLVNKAPQVELSTIFQEYGDLTERDATYVSRLIVTNRQREGDLLSVGDLLEALKPYTNAGFAQNRFKKNAPQKKHIKIHPATRIFQALRIKINDELASVSEGLESAIPLLKVGGRVACLSFHSLEDKLVTQAFKRAVQTGNYKLVTKKPLRATNEVVQNPRARSVRLRGLERIA